MNSPPDRWIRALIAQEGGRTTFERFMELALYHPDHGYYRAKPTIGQTGDFFTSVSVGPLFGRILARQFLKFREELGNPADFQIVEYGGHAGRLRDDVLSDAPGLPYRIVEAGDPQPDTIHGCVISNELLDAFPVHRVRLSGGLWQELYVEYDFKTDSFRETAGALSTPRLNAILDVIQTADLVDGYTTEINLRALDWIRDVAQRLTRGYVITIDYGLERQDYFAPHRKEGTLLCYHQHQENRDPFLRVGRQDMTTHVEFTSLREAGEAAGLETLQFCDQTRFLLDAGRDVIEDIVSRHAGHWSPERNQLHQLMHPGFMGKTFKVLMQRKK